MVLSVPTNTYNYLQAAGRDGLMPRWLVFMHAKHRDTGADETVGIWSGGYAQTLTVIRPDNGATQDRVYQPGAGVMSIPDIPMMMSLEVSRLTLTFGRLTPAIVGAVKVYDPRRQSLQIHLALLDPKSNRTIDPAMCVWDGLIDSVLVKRDKVAGRGTIEVTTTNHAVMLQQTNAIKMSAAFFEERGDQAGRYIATLWRVRVPWGQDAIHHNHQGRRRLRFFR
jgi:hypothetical protein